MKTSLKKAKVSKSTKKPSSEKFEKLSKKRFNKLKEVENFYKILNKYKLRLEAKKVLLEELLKPKDSQ